MTPEQIGLNRMRAEVAREFEGRCPCCGGRMSDARVRPRQRMPRNRRTRGHNKPVQLGGNTMVWVSMCWGCNWEQSTLTFEQWAAKLKAEGDERWHRVNRLAHIVNTSLAAYGVKP